MRRSVIIRESQPPGRTPQGIRPSGPPAFGLLDGQQRTLALLTGWPLGNGQETMDRRLWVDFADRPGREHLFRLCLTSANHAFGYQRENPSARLPIFDRRVVQHPGRKSRSLRNSDGTSSWNLELMSGQFGKSRTPVLWLPLKTTPGISFANAGEGSGGVLTACGDRFRCIFSQL